MTWLRIEGPLGPCIVADAHLDHMSEAARLGGAALVRERLAAAAGGAPVVLGGDFNTCPGGAVHTGFVRDGWVDGYLEAGGVDDAHAYTFHDFSGQRQAGETRIDWVLHTPPLRAVRARIVRHARPPRYPSDHYPVVVDLVTG